MTDFIVLTANLEEEYKTKAEELGVILYLDKFDFSSGVLKPYTGRWKTAMVVDDAIYVRLGVELVLQEYGCESVSLYPDPHSALEAYKKEKPDLVVTDVNMKSDMDGFDLIEAIRAL